MCFDADARPPDLPEDLVMPAVGGGAAAEVTELPCGDGSGASFGVALAPGSGPAPGVVILPDVRGLYPFYIELAERFAAAGMHAVILDYFGRTAGAGVRDEHFDPMSHVPSTSPEQVQGDIATAREALAERAELTCVVTVGFCFGGAQSFLAAGNEGLGLDGAVGFYGTLNPDRFAGRGLPPMPAPLHHADETRCPVLGLFGGADDLIPEEDVESFEGALEEVGVEHELVTYPGAPHSFFDRAYTEFADESADAWRRVIDFIERIPARSPA